MSKRIAAFPQAASLLDDDLVAVDSLADGTRAAPYELFATGLRRGKCSGTLAAGDVARAKGTSATGTEVHFAKTPASSADVQTDALYLVLVGGADGAEAAVVRHGLVEAVAVANSPSVDDLVYVNDSGHLDKNSGTNLRACGRVARVEGAGLYTVAFDGSGGGGGGGGGGGVSSVGATAPIASTGGANPVISIAAATTGAAGSLSAADKTKLDATDPTLIPTSGQKSALAGTSGTPGSGNKYATDADPRLSDQRDAASLQGTAVASGAPSSGRFLKFNGTNWAAALVALSDAYAGGNTITPTNAGGVPKIDASGAGANTLDAALSLIVDGTVAYAALLLRATGAGFIAKIKGEKSSVTGAGGVVVQVQGGDGDATHGAGDLLLDAGKDNGGGSGHVYIGAIEVADVIIGGSNEQGCKFKTPLNIGDGSGDFHGLAAFTDDTAAAAPGPQAGGAFIRALIDSYSVVRMFVQASAGGEVPLLTREEKIVTKTSNYTLSADDDVVHVDSSGGAVTLTVPTPLLKRWKVKKIGTGTNKISIARHASEKIENTAATYDLPGSTLAPSLTQPLGWELYGDATDWWVV